MDPLTRKEEEVLRILIDLERAFVKDIIAAMPGKKPAYTTVSTVVRKLEEKGYVDHEDFGSTYRYFPTVRKSDLRKRDLGELLGHYFEGSYKSLVSHFARDRKLTREDLEDIIRLIEEE